MTSPFDQVILQTDVDQLETNELSLLETLDHVLNRGLVIAGEITISVADIDLIFLGLNVLVSSVEKAHEVLRERELPGIGPNRSARKGSKNRNEALCLLRCFRDGYLAGSGVKRTQRR